MNPKFSEIVILRKVAVLSFIAGWLIMAEPEWKGLFH
jgi:hypothetical protein